MSEMSQEDREKRIEEVRKNAEAFFGREVDLPFRNWSTLDDYLKYVELHPMAEPYYDKQGRSWFTSADKQKYNRKHKGKGKGKKRRKR